MNKPTGAVALVPKTKPGNSGRVVRYLKGPRFRKKIRLQKTAFRLSQAVEKD